MGESMKPAVGGSGGFVRVVSANKTSKCFYQWIYLTFDILMTMYHYASQ
jgi:hypothetical protein